MKNYHRFLAIVVAVMVLFLFLSGVVYKSFIGMELTTQLASYGFIALFILIFVLDFIPQYFSPFMVLISALLFGLDAFAACLVSVVASASASIAAFSIGRRASKRFVEKVVGGSAKKSKSHNEHHLTMRIINGWGRWVVLATAITPLPYFPMLFGAMRMRKDNFYLFGIIPRILAFVVVTIVLALLF